MLIRTFTVLRVMHISSCVFAGMEQPVHICSHFSNHCAKRTGNIQEQIELWLRLGWPTCSCRPLQSSTCLSLWLYNVPLQHFRSITYTLWIIIITTINENIAEQHKKFQLLCSTSIGNCCMWSICRVCCVTGLHQIVFLWLKLCSWGSRRFDRHLIFQLWLLITQTQPRRSHLFSP